jgi:hypothetical protein
MGKGYGKKGKRSTSRECSPFFPYPFLYFYSPLYYNCNIIVTGIKMRQWGYGIF